MYLEKYRSQMKFFGKKKHIYPINGDLTAFKSALRNERDLEFSDSKIERICVSGDISGSPFAHWRWRMRYLSDLVIWPKNKEQLSYIIKNARNHNIPLTPRGGGTSYFGSSQPACGGAVLDLKLLRGIKIDEGSKCIHVQAGTTFQMIINELDQKMYQLGCYPSSARSSTVGGWIGTGGKVGIGSFQHGSFSNQVIELEVLDANGKIIQITEKNEINAHFGKNGIFGIVSSAKIQIFLKKEKIPLLFEFENINDSIAVLERMSLNDNVHSLRWSDYESISKPNLHETKKFYLFLILNQIGKQIEPIKSKLIKQIERENGLYLGDGNSKLEHSKQLNHEMILKNTCPVLMLQTLATSIANAKIIIQSFQKRAASLRLENFFSALVGKNGTIRLVLFTPTDSEYITHFLASKGVLNDVVKIVYEKSIGKVYTHGLINSMYLKQFEKELYDEVEYRKQMDDVAYILNPLKLINTTISYKRIQVIFGLNKFWRKMAIKLKKAKKLEFFIEQNYKNNKK